MSRVRRVQIGFAATVAVVAMMFGVDAAAAEPGPTTIPEVPEQVVSTGVLQTEPREVAVTSTGATGSSGTSGSSAGFGRNKAAVDDRVLSTVLAQTGSNTGILVISGVVLLVIGASLMGGRRVYGD